MSKSITQSTSKGLETIFSWLVKQHELLKADHDAEFTIEKLAIETNQTQAAVREQLRYLDRLLTAVRIGKERVGMTFIPGQGAPPIQATARRRARWFEMLLERRSQENGSPTATSKLSVDEAMSNHLVTDASTVRNDFHEIFDFAQSMRLQEEMIEAGTYAFSNFLAREKRNYQLKEEIAEIAATLIPPGVSIAVTEGSTAAMCIVTLLARQRHVSITTNNLLVLQARDLEHCEVYLCGGTYHYSTHCTTGARAVRDFQRRACQFAMIGAYAIDGDGTVYAYHHEDCAVQNAAIESCSTIIIACDTTKLTRRGRWAFVNLPSVVRQKKSKVIVITNNPASLNERDRESVRSIIGSLESHGIEVHYQRPKAE